MMRDAVINVIGPRTSSRGGGGLSLLVLVGALVAVFLAGAAFLGSLQQTMLSNDPSVRAAEARAEVAQADLRAAQAEHDAASIRHSESIEATWDPITAGVVHGVVLGLLVAGPAFLLLSAGLLLRRHLSLPTKDGRVSIVGLDRELSREALIRYQLRELAGVATYEALPVKTAEEATSTAATESGAAV